MIDNKNITGWCIFTVRYEDFLVHDSLNCCHEYVISRGLFSLVHYCCAGTSPLRAGICTTRWDDVWENRCGRAAVTVRATAKTLC